MIIKLTLDRFEDEDAVFLSGDGETILWPRHLLPDSAREGQILDFRIGTDLAGESDQRQTAKKILNEILGK